MRPGCLRPARETDAGAIGAILSEFVDETTWLPRIYSRAEELGSAGTMIQRDWVRVIEHSGRVVGFSALDKETVHALYVARGQRRRGLGAAILCDLQSRAPRLRLWTQQANMAAQAFYAVHGFREVARSDGAGNDDALPDVQLLWERPAR